MICYKSSDIFRAFKLRIPDSVLEQRCRDEHLCLLSLELNWREVAPFLQLTPMQIMDITVDCHCESERRIAALRVWMETFGDMATYGKLIGALLECRLRTQARNICQQLLKLLRPSGSSTDSQEYFTPPETSPSLPPRNARRVSAQSTATQTHEYRSNSPADCGYGNRYVTRAEVVEKYFKAILSTKAPHSNTLAQAYHQAPPLTTECQHLASTTFEEAVRLEAAKRQKNFRLYLVILTLVGLGFLFIAVPLTYVVTVSLE